MTERERERDSEFIMWECLLMELIQSRTGIERARWICREVIMLRAHCPSFYAAELEELKGEKERHCVHEIER